MEDMALALCEVLFLDRVPRAGTQKPKKVMEKHKEFGGAPKHFCVTCL